MLTPATRSFWIIFTVTGTVYDKVADTSIGLTVNFRFAIWQEFYISIENDLYGFLDSSVTLG